MAAPIIINCSTQDQLSLHIVNYHKTIAKHYRSVTYFTMKIVPFTLNGLNNTWNAKTSPFAARNIKGSTIVPITLHALIKLIFQLPHMDIKNHIYIRFLTARGNKLFRLDCTRISKISVIFPLHGLTQFFIYTAWNTETPPFHSTEYNCAIYTAWLNKSYLPYTPHGNNKNFFMSLHGLPKYTSAYSLPGLTKLFRFQCMD